MKVYVAAHCRWAALHAASVLRAAGHTINSTWIDQPFHPTESVPPEDRAVIAAQDACDVAEADALVLIAGPDRYPGGKFVEVGIALGRDKAVIVIGRRENMLMYHPRIVQVDTPEQAVKALQEAFL